MECFRRFALTGLAVFIYPESSAQVAVVLLLAAVFMVASEIIAPFERLADMWLYRIGHYVVFASMFLALLLRVDVSNEREQSQEVFSGVIIIAHAVMLLVVVAQGLLIFIGWGDLVEVPNSLKDVDNDDSVDYEKGEAEPGSKTSPGCGRSSTKNADPLVEKERREKRWEIWERVAPTAKSSFFPSPAKRRGSGASSLAASLTAFHTSSPTPSIQCSEKAGGNRSCRSLSPNRRCEASTTDISHKSSTITAGTKVLAYIEVPPENRERDGFEAAMTAAGFVPPMTVPRNLSPPADDIQQAIDTSSRTADISASSRFGKTNAVLPQAEASFVRPAVEEKSDSCTSPTKQRDGKLRTFKSWSPQQRYRSVTATREVVRRTAGAEKKTRKRTLAKKQGDSPNSPPTDDVTTTGKKESYKRSPANAMAKIPGTRSVVSATIVRSKSGSSPGAPASSRTPALDARTTDAKTQAALPSAESSQTPSAGVLKPHSRTKPGSCTDGESKTPRKSSSHSPLDESPPKSPPKKEASPKARLSPWHPRKVYTPAWRLESTETAEPGVKSSGLGQKKGDVGLELQETRSRGREKKQGRQGRRREGRSSPPGSSKFATGRGITHNDRRRAAVESSENQTEINGILTENGPDNVPNPKNELRNAGGLSIGMRSYSGSASGTEEVEEVGMRTRLREGWAPRYPLIRTSPTL